MSTSTFTIKRLVVGQMAVNCYFLIDKKTKDTIIVDPGDEAQYLAGEIEKEKFHPVSVIGTHGHFDHILAAFELQHIYKIPFCLNCKDEFLLDRMRDSAQHFLGRKIIELPPKLTQRLKKDDVVNFGKSFLSVLETPGHTPGSISLYCKNEHAVFVGDLIFAGGGVGRTDFSYSSPSDLQTSIQKILRLPKNTIIYPGHGEETTVKRELSFY